MCVCVFVCMCVYVRLCRVPTFCSCVCLCVGHAWVRHRAAAPSACGRSWVALIVSAVMYIYIWMNKDVNKWREASRATVIPL
jgi:hypothetical protein